MTRRVHKSDMIRSIRGKAPEPELVDLRWREGWGSDDESVMNVYMIVGKASYDRACKDSANSWRAVEDLHRAVAEEFLRWTPSRRPHVSTRTDAEQARIDADKTYDPCDQEWLDPDDDVVRDLRIDALEVTVEELEGRVAWLEARLEQALAALAAHGGIGDLPDVKSAKPQAPPAMPTSGTGETVAWKRHVYDGPVDSPEPVPCRKCGLHPRAGAHFTNGGVVCDMEEGPCACGASHRLGDHQRRDIEWAK